MKNIISLLIDHPEISTLCSIISAASVLIGVVSYLLNNRIVLKIYDIQFDYDQKNNTKYLSFYLVNTSTKIMRVSRIRCLDENNQSLLRNESFYKHGAKHYILGKDQKEEIKLSLDEIPRYITILINFKSTNALFLKNRVISKEYINKRYKKDKEDEKMYKRDHTGLEELF